MFAVRFIWLLILAEILMICSDQVVLGRVAPRRWPWGPYNWRDTRGFDSNEIEFAKEKIDDIENRVDYVDYNSVRQPQPGDFVFPSGNFVPLIRNYNEESAGGGNPIKYLYAVAEEEEVSKHSDESIYSPAKPIPLINDRNILQTPSFKWRARNDDEESARNGNPVKYFYAVAEKKEEEAPKYSDESINSPAKPIPLINDRNIFQTPSFKSQARNDDEESARNGNPVKYFYAVAEKKEEEAPKYSDESINPPAKPIPLITDRNIFQTPPFEGTSDPNKCGNGKAWGHGKCRVIHGK